MINFIEQQQKLNICMRLLKRNLHLLSLRSKTGSRAILSGCSPRHKRLIGDQFILGAEENILIKGYIERKRKIGGKLSWTCFEEGNLIVYRSGACSMVLLALNCQINLTYIEQGVQDYTGWKQFKWLWSHFFETCSLPITNNINGTGNFKFIKKNKWNLENESNNAVPQR